jgi:hypothetical protein
MLAAVWAALWGAGQVASGQYGPMGGPASPYPDMMAPGSMGMPGPSPYAPPAFAPASYAGIGGPAPMGPMGSMAGPGMPMGSMPGQMGPMPGSPDMSGMSMGGMGGGMPGGMQGMAGVPGYAGGYCDDGCNGWTNKYFAFGEFLYLRPRNAEVAYAVPVNGAALAGGSLVPAGAVRVADPDYAAGFRVGMGAVISPRSAIAVTYTQFDRDTFDATSLPGNGAVIRSLVNSPNPLTAGGNGLDTAATLQTQFQLLDIDYKGLIYYTPQAQLAYVVGARYGNLEQHFAAGFAPASGFQEVLAESEFDGGGLKLGLEGLRFHPTSQFFVYGKGYASMLAGTFRTHYQLNDNGATITDTGFKAGRLVTMLDLEGGVGWQNFTGNLRFSMGYMFSSWFNTVKVNELINSVQTNNFLDPSTNYRGMTTFDGLTSKIELLW